MKLFRLSRTMNISITYPSPGLSLKAIVMRFAAAIGLSDENKGARRLFTDTVKTYDSMIRRICFGYSRTAEDLEDLYQDVLVNLWQSMTRYRGEASMKTWVYRIALNTCVSTVRSHSRRINGTPIDVLVNVADDAEEVRADISELHECISTLPPLDSAVVMLWLDEYTYDEIAEMVGLSRGNVAVRLHRAKEKLKVIYQHTTA